MTADHLKLMAEYNALRKRCNSQDMLIKNQNQTITMLETKMEDMVEESVTKAVSKVKKEYEKIIIELNNKIAKLESKLNINSSNSSVPMSKNPINAKISNLRKKSGKTVGGQVGHKQHKLDYFKEEEITETIEHKKDNCTICNSSNLELKDIVISDIIDFDIILKRERNQIFQYNCLDCKKTISSNEMLPRGASYGSNINASAILLMNDCNVPINKVRKHFIGLTNDEINMSEGYISKLQARTASKLDHFILELKEVILKEKIVHWDDTEIKIGTKKGYLRFYGNEKLAYLIAHASKGEKSFEEDGILENLSSNTTLIHDHVLYLYNEKFHFKNGECNSHILRYLQGVTDNIHDHTWEKKLTDLLIEANENRVGKTHYEQSYIDDVYSRYDEIIKLAYRENNRLADYHFYHKKEQLLISRLDKFKDSHLLFIKDFNVPFSNNTAEKSFRISKTKVKVSGLFQNITTAENYAKILTYIETCYRNGMNKHQAIKRLLDGNPYTVKELLNMHQ